MFPGKHREVSRRFPMILPFPVPVFPVSRSPRRHVSSTPRSRYPSRWPSVASLTISSRPYPPPCAFLGRISAQMRSLSSSIAALAALAAPAHRAVIESRIVPRSARPAASQRPISAATGRSSSTSRATARVPRRRDSNRTDSRWISSPTSLRSSSFSPISPSKARALPLTRSGVPPETPQPYSFAASLMRCGPSAQAPNEGACPLKLPRST